jgi:predicted DNA-binding transcriptional regulator AlpA
MGSDLPCSTTQYLNTEEAAHMLKLSPRTLEKQRVTGEGPRFRKFGSRVLYAAADIQSWADARTFSNTSEAQNWHPRKGR